MNEEEVNHEEIRFALTTKYAKEAGRLRGSIKSLIYDAAIFEMIGYDEEKWKKFRAIIAEILAETDEEPTEAQP
jgi:hypothetical protein